LRIARCALIADARDRRIVVMWWFWARVVAAGLATPPGPRGADATVAPSRAGQPVASDLSTVTPRAEHPPARVTSDPPPPPPGPKVTLADGDVIRALEQRQPNFLRCFHAAQKDDLMLVTARVSLHVRVGPTGTIDEATADGGPPKLDACVETVAKHLEFDAPEEPVEASLNLFFE
jgi:hypothetical protein